MKKNYEKPTIEIEEFEIEDILTLSSNSSGIAEAIGWGQIQ